MKWAHLWKRILNEGIAKITDTPDERIEVLQSQIVKAPIIVDNSCIDDLGGEIEWEEYTGTLGKNGSLSIPFSQFWVEGNLGTNGNLWGALIKADGPNETGEHVLNIWCFSTNQCHQVMFFGRVDELRINRGSLILDRMDWPVYMPDAVYGKIKDGAGRLISTIVAKAMDVMLLLGCKNVSLSPRDNESQQVRRAIKRHGSQSHGYRYHVLVVKPPGARSNVPGQEIGTMPRHICRGHLAEYGPKFGKGLLFGKYEGRFFVPPCLKGKAENGIVEKDYALCPTN